MYCTYFIGFIVTCFSLTEVFTNHKRLRLLLMPLVVWTLLPFPSVIISSPFPSTLTCIIMYPYSCTYKYMSSLSLSLSLSLPHRVQLRCVEVDEARVFTWWYLISKLLPVCSHDTKIHVYTEVRYVHVS